MLEDLNKEQKEVVLNKVGSLVNIAGPGSGKTKTLISKINYIMSNNLVKNINELLVLTFTNNSALEIKERALSTIKLTEQVKYFGTFHSIFLKLLNEKDLIEKEYETKPTIVSQNEIIRTIKHKLKNKLLLDNNSKKVLELAYKKNYELNTRTTKKSDKLTLTMIDNYIFNIKDIILLYEKEINFLKVEDLKINNLKSYKDMLNYIKNKCLNNIFDEYEKEITKYLPFTTITELKKLKTKEYFKNYFEYIYDEMINIKLEQKLIVFSDLLLLMLYFLYTNKTFLDEIQNKFKYIFIDEYQDTNIIENEIIQLIYNNKNNSINICTIGDPYQSIYGFLGANIKNIMEANKTFNAKEIQLLINYRSTQNIVELTNIMGKNMLEKIESWIPCKSFNNKTNKKIKYAFFEQQQNNYNSYNRFQKIPTLNDKIIEIIEKIPKQKTIAILKRSGFTSPLENLMIKNKIEYTKYGGISMQEAIEVQILLHLFYYIQNPTKKISLKIILENTVGIGTTSVENYIFKDKANKKIETIKEYLTKLELLNLKDKKQIINYFYENIFPKISVKWKEKRHLEAKDRIKVLTEKILELDTVEEINFFFDEFLLFQHNEKDKNRIVISTIHSAKGLEWDVVILADWEERSFSKDKIEEAQRLNYVAISRAKEELYILANGNNIFQLEDNNLKNKKIFEYLN